MKKIAIIKPFITPLDETLIEKIRQEAPNYSVVYYQTEPIAVEDLTDAEIIFGWSDEVKEALERDNHIKWIHVWFAGVDKLPLDLINKNQTILSTASGANAPVIAQQVIGLMLMQVRRLDANLMNQQEHIWTFPDGMTEITDRKVLILGTGNIARELVKHLKSFGITIYGVNTTGHPVDFIETVYPITDYHHALAQMDYVINALPLTKQTTQLIDSAFFAAMSTNGFYINFGRGKTTDEQALIHALEHQQIKGAMLDVVAEEPLPEESPLWEMPNVYITPHSAGQSDYYNARVVQLFIDNLKDYHTKDKPTVNVVNFEKEY